MGARNRFRAWGESAAVMVAIVLIPLWPRPVIVGLARLLGALAYRIAGRDRRVAMANVEMVFGDRYDQEARVRITRASFQTFALVLLDYFWFARRTAARLRKYVWMDASCSNYFTGKAALVVSGHFGNWEVMGLKVSAEGEPCISVVAALENAFVNRQLNRMRRVNGQEVLDREGALAGILRALKRGRKIALIMDQNTLPQQGGIFLDFFGLPAPISRAVGMLSVRMQVPVNFGYCLIEGWGYRMYAGAPIQPEGEGEEAMTRALVREFERIITQHPEHWLWMYKRWKYLPPGHSGAGYPFYARRPAPEA